MIFSKHIDLGEGFGEERRSSMAANAKRNMISASFGNVVSGAMVFLSQSFGGSPLPYLQDVSFLRFL